MGRIDEVWKTNRRKGDDDHDRDGDEPSRSQADQTEAGCEYDTLMNGSDKSRMTHHLKLLYDRELRCKMRFGRWRSEDQSDMDRRRMVHGVSFHHQRNF